MYNPYLLAVGAVFILQLAINATLWLAGFGGLAWLLLVVVFPIQVWLGVKAGRWQRTNGAR